MGKDRTLEIIKTEIERLIEESDFDESANLYSLLSFLSTLEQSEKPMELEEEINRYLEPIHTADIQFEPFTQMTKCARHFAEWGYLRAAEKYNEIEYNRQRAEEPVSDDLEEAAEIGFDEAYALTEDYRDFLAKGLTENRPRPIGPHWFCEYAKNRFIAGSKWQAEKDTRDMYMSDNRHFQKVYELGRTDMREQMLKDAVEGEITKDNRGNNVVRTGVFNNGFEIGDKVRVIIVKDD